MLRLKKGRMFQIPNGFRFKLQLGPNKFWEPQPFSSFDSVVAGLQGVIINNPGLAQKYRWPTTAQAIGDWVEGYNAQLCAANGWTDYYEGDGGPGIPKMSAAQQAGQFRRLSAVVAKVKQLAEGYRAINEWKASGDPAVPPAQSASRAATCAACPLNLPGDWSSWFTKPAAELIRKDIERIQERKLSTPDDEKLNVCSTCFCPMRLKVHIPLPYITRALKPETIEKLKAGKDCWVVAEIKGQ